MAGDRTEWDARYRAKAETPTHPPSRFLAAHLHQLPVGRALDIGCGDGRHSILLARHGFTVDAVDFARPGLERLAAAARSDGLAVRCIQADLETFPLPLARYHVVVDIRYLQRSLFDPIKRALVPGGIVVFETFLRDQQAFGHPRNPAFLLERGELADRFADWECIEYEEGLCETETGPAYLARMLARRPLH